MLVLAWIFKAAVLPTQRSYVRRLSAAGRSCQLPSLTLLRFSRSNYQTRDQGIHFCPLPLFRRIAYVGACKEVVEGKSQS
jgi:hypothetical protein